MQTMTPTLLAYIAGRPVPDRTPTRREAVLIAGRFRRHREDGFTVPQAIRLARAEVLGQPAKAA